MLAQKRSSIASSETANLTSVSQTSSLSSTPVTTYTVPIPKPKETLATTSMVKVSTIDYQKENGKVTVVVDASAEAPSVKLVRVAAWSESNQSNLKWYTAADLKNGQVQITVDIANHKYIDGNYIIHTYIDYQDGSTKGFNLGQYNLIADNPAISKTVTGQAKSIIDMAASLLGVKNGDAEHKKIIDDYNSVTPKPVGYTATYDDNWCDIFTTVMFQRSGLSHLIG